ncbi:MAG: patatin family protein [Lachnospiraceae bacterium]|nr:patatin family protein [Lachnospiraceae bacterium]
MDIVKRDEKVGLVLEGGGMRGMYTTGVLDVLMKEKLFADAVIGVSAGAVFGCSYMSEQYGRGLRYNLKYINDDRYVSMKSWLKTGNIFNEKFCYDELPNKLDVYDYDKFQENAAKVPFYVCCTNVDTGKPEYIRCTDFREEMDYMRASASLPLVSKIVYKGGKKLLDGGCSDSIPVDYFRSIGYKKNIVVLTRPAGYVKRPSSTAKLLRLRYKKYPDFVQANLNRHDDYNKSLWRVEEYERQGEALIIRPSIEYKIGRLERDKEKLQYMYNLGRQDANTKLEEIKVFLAEK